LNRTDLIREMARREAMAAAWAKSAKEIRARVEADARAEFEANGNGVTWTMRDLGKVILPLSVEAPTVADADVLLKWVAKRHPEQVETVLQVRPAFQTWLLKNVQIGEGAVVIDPETGEVVPGLGVREGGRPGALTLRVDAPVKQLLANYAEQEVTRALAAEYGPVEAAQPAEIRCIFCGEPIRDGEPIDMIGNGYGHAECPNPGRRDGGDQEQVA
jgi:hypothetical protein